MTVPTMSSPPPTVSLRSTSAIRLPSDQDPGENNDGAWGATGQSFHYAVGSSSADQTSRLTRKKTNPRQIAAGRRRPERLGPTVVRVTSEATSAAPAGGAVDGIASLRLPPAATTAVPAMFGYRTPPMPGVHRGLPSPFLTLVFSLSGAIPIDVPTGDGVRSGTYSIPVGGLHTQPVLLPQPFSAGTGSSSNQGTVAQCGLQLAVHPFAARALFGMPA